jgi:hypothetical protein
MNLTERAEGAEQRVLHEILGVPKLAREAEAVRVERRPERPREVDVAMPRGAQLVAKRCRELGLCHRASSEDKTSRRPSRIRRKAVLSAASSAFTGSYQRCCTAGR